jgi:hypothetical protein
MLRFDLHSAGGNSTFISHYYQIFIKNMINQISTIYQINNMFAFSYPKYQERTNCISTCCFPARISNDFELK